MTTTATGLRAATSWLLHTGILGQFRVAKEMQDKDKKQSQNQQE
jgi:hypothetical protein